MLGLSMPFGQEISLRNVRTFTVSIPSVQRYQDSISHEILYLYSKHCELRKRVFTAPGFSEYLVFAFSELSRYVVFYSVLRLIESHYEKKQLLFIYYMKNVLLSKLSSAVIAHCVEIYGYS